MVCMRQLIVVADDLGICEQRDAGILQCLADGFVSSTCVLANGATAASALSTCLQRGHDVGLHLNLTAGRSLAPPSSITDVTGMFLGKQGLRQAIARGDVDEMDVANEIRAQVKWFAERNAGRAPTWCNGHNHVHVYPVIAAVFAREMQTFGVTGTRMCVQSSHHPSPPSPATDRTPFHLQITADAAASAAIFARHALKWPPAFAGFNVFGCSDVQRMAEEVNAAFQSARVVELMCHVGRAGSGDTGFGADDVCATLQLRVIACLTAAQDAFNSSLDREHELRCLASMRLSALTSSSLISFSKMLAAHSACSASVQGMSQ